MTEITVICYLPQFTKAAVEQDIVRTQRKLRPLRVVFAGPVEFAPDGVTVEVSDSVKPAGHYWIVGTTRENLR